MRVLPGRAPPGSASALERADTPPPPSIAPPGPRPAAQGVPSAGEPFPLVPWAPAHALPSEASPSDPLPVPTDLSAASPAAEPDGTICHPLASLVQVVPAVPATAARDHRGNRREGLSPGPPATLTVRSASQPNRTRSRVKGAKFSHLAGPWASAAASLPPVREPFSELWLSSHGRGWSLKMRMEQ